ncbi:penicillin-binding protein activator [Candidatus Fermentibacterales bacterium]|nr:penicillin-binding protein activator [Candidatus Fermentibacterales bacterium]
MTRRPYALVASILMLAAGLLLSGCRRVDDPSSPEGMARLARTDMEEGRFEDALGIARDLLDRFPDHHDVPEWYLLEANALGSLGYSDQALQAAQTAESQSRSASTAGRARLYQVELLEAGSRFSEALDRLAGLSMEDLARSDGDRARSLALTGTSEVSTDQLIELRQTTAGWLELFLLLELERRAAASGDYEHAILYGAEIDRLFPSAREEYGRPELAGPERPYIALLMPLAGEGSVWGTQVARGVRLAFSQFEDLHADSPALLELDTSVAGESVAALLESLASDPSCVAAIGPLTSAETLEAGRLAHDLGIPLLSPTATSASIDGIGSFVHRLVVKSGDEAAAVAEYAVLTAGEGRIAILHPYTAEAVSEAEQFRRTAEQLGATVVAVEGYETGDTDFREQIRSIKARSPDAVFLPVSAWDAIQIAPQLRFYDVRVSIYGTSGWDNEMVPRLGEEYVEGAVFTVSFGSSSLYPPAARFSYLFRRSFEGTDPTREAAQGYDSATLMLKAWESPPHTRNSIESYLSRITCFDGVLGRVTLGSRDLPRVSYPLVRIEDGEIISVE